jgi:biotin transport system permease protein
VSTFAVFVPGESVLHRAPAGAKLLALALAAVLSVLIRKPWQVLVLLVVVVVLYLVARIPWRTALAQGRPLLWFAAALTVFQLLVSGWEKAVVIVGGMLGLVLLAALVSLTTRTTEIVDAVVAGAGPLRRVGADPERLGLLVALAVRAVPVIVDLAREVRQAQVARGAAASPTAFVVPLVVRSLRHADRLADALVARGIDD